MQLLCSTTASAYDPWLASGRCASVPLHTFRSQHNEQGLCAASGSHTSRRDSGSDIATSGALGIPSIEGPSTSTYQYLGLSRIPPASRDLVNRAHAPLVLRLRESRSIPLHTFNPNPVGNKPRWSYTPTKIGGHALDHIRSTYRVVREGLGLGGRHSGHQWEENWGLDPRRRFGGLSIPVMLELQQMEAGVAPSGKSAPQQEDELLAYMRYLRSCFLGRETPRPGPPSVAPPGPLVPYPLHPYRTPPTALVHDHCGPLEECETATDVVYTSPEASRRSHPPAHESAGALAAVSESPHTQAAVAVLLSRLAQEAFGGPAGEGGGELPSEDQAAVVMEVVYDGLTCTDPSDPSPALGEVTARLVQDPGLRGWRGRLAQVPGHSKMHRYRFVKTLGKGSHGAALLVRLKKPPRAGARPQGERQGGLLRVLKECEALKEGLNEARLLTLVGAAGPQENVVRLHDFFVETVGHRTVAYLELEHCPGGDLAQLIRDIPEGLGARDLLLIAKGMCAGLQTLHGLGIVHRDLTPANVLLAERPQADPLVGKPANLTEGEHIASTDSDGGRWVVKLADLGVSTRLSGTRPLTEHPAGSLCFMAPEVQKFLLGASVAYDERADVWGVGAIVYAMAVGDPSPSGLTSRPAGALASQAARATGSQDVADVLLAALQADPRRRPPVAEVAQLIDARLLSAPMLQRTISSGRTCRSTEKVNTRYPAARL